MWEQFQSLFTQSGYGHALSSLALIISILGVRSILLGQILKSNWRREDQRKWLVKIKNLSTFSVFFGLVMIWATELQTFALSIVAITGALIISGKELLLCVFGGVLRSSNNLFKIGDRIEIDGIRGDVIDTNLFFTKILEIGPSTMTHQFTGRSVSIPNGLYLTKELINESFMHKYVLHVFKIALKRTDDWRKAEKCMLEAANEECSSFIALAQENMDQLAKKEGLDVPKVTPRITYRFSALKDIEMIVRVPAPATRKGHIEQQILKRFMNKFFPDPELETQK